MDNPIDFFYLCISGLLSDCWSFVQVLPFALARAATVGVTLPRRSATPLPPPWTLCLEVYAKNLNQTYTHIDECTCTHVEPFFASIGMCRKTFFWAKVFASLRNCLLLLSLMMMKMVRRKRESGKAKKAVVGGRVEPQLRKTRAAQTIRNDGNNNG